MEIKYKKIDKDTVEEITPKAVDKEVRQFSVEKMRKNLPIWENLAENLQVKINRAKKIIELADK